LVVNETLSSFSTKADFRAFSDSRNNNFKSLLCVFKDAGNFQYAYDHSDVGFNKFLQDSSFSKFSNKKTDPALNLSYDNLSLGDVVILSKTAPNDFIFVELKTREKILTPSVLKQEFDLDSHLAKQCFYMESKGVYFREPFSKFKQLTRLVIK
jgi:hypothetical protein